MSSPKKEALMVESVGNRQGTPLSSPYCGKARPLEQPGGSRAWACTSQRPPQRYGRCEAFQRTKMFRQGFVRFPKILKLLRRKQQLPSSAYSP